jgi:hypothetical protein
MFTRNSLLTFLLLSLSTLWSCDFFGGDDNPKPEPENPADALPPATQAGENTFGALVNGRAWIPKGCVGSGAGADLFWPNFFTLGADWACTDESMGLFITSPDGTLITTQSYPIVSSFVKDDFESRGGGRFVSNGICIYDGDHVLDGKITLTRLDKKNKIVAGTFEFSTVREGCDTIRVTDGRFDFRYID